MSNSIQPEVCRDGSLPPMRRVDQFGIVPVLVGIVSFVQLDHFDGGLPLPQVSYLGVLISAVIYALVCHEDPVVRVIVFNSNAVPIRRRFEYSFCF
jgi:hypothetical protein